MMCLLVSTKKSYLTLTWRGSLRWLTPAAAISEKRPHQHAGPARAQPKIAPMVVFPKAENPGSR
jgi:hypothetical protein